MPDVVILSRVARIIIMGELTVPWEDNVEEVHERKKEKYEKLVMQCGEGCQRAISYPFEVGCRGFAVQSMMSFPCCFGVVRRRGECVRGLRRQLNLDQQGFGGRGVGGEEVRSSSVADQPSMSHRHKVTSAHPLHQSGTMIKGLKPLGGF